MVKSNLIEIYASAEILENPALGQHSMVHSTSQLTICISPSAHPFILWSTLLVNSLFVSTLLLTPSFYGPLYQSTHYLYQPFCSPLHSMVHSTSQLTICISLSAHPFIPPLPLSMRCTPSILQNCT